MEGRRDAEFGIAGGSGDTGGVFVGACGPAVAARSGRQREKFGNCLRLSNGVCGWCPCRDGNGNRTVRNDYTYIYMPDESRYYYRHLLFIAWRVKHVAPEHNRLFLDSSLVTLDKMTTEVLKSLYLTRIPCLFELLDRLYWDSANGRPARGIVSPSKVSAGDLIHRFPTRIRQLEKTYDLQTLDANQLLEILGDEFQQRAAKSQSQMELNI